MSAKRTDPKPFCACGCRQRVKLHRHTWLRGHMPMEIRRAQLKAAGRQYAFLARRRHFNQDIDRLPRSVKRADLLALMATVYNRGYQAGYQQARKGRENRHAA